MSDPENSAYMFKIPPRNLKVCGDCGEEYRGSEESERCTSCHFLMLNPEYAPRYWTWTRGPRDTWKVTARWPDMDNPPEPGQTITVHRKNGSSSEETISEVGEFRLDRAAEWQITCKVN